MENYYNEEHYYKEVIAPLIRQIRVYCIAKHMPMFFTVAVENSESGTKYESEMVLALSGTHLTDNKIKDLLLYLNDFKLVHPKYIENDIKELDEYVSQLEKRQIKKNSDVTLMDDKISGMEEIADRGAHVEFPDGTFGSDQGMEEADTCEPDAQDFGN